jgi:phospholipid/cholesterol/gamma-HCH transport system permease protein
VSAFIERFGNGIIIISEELGRTLLLLGAAVKRMMLPPWEFKNTVRRMPEIGARSSAVVRLIAMYAATVFALGHVLRSKRFPAVELVGTIDAISMTGGIGRVYMGLIAARHDGASMAAEIGLSGVTEQFEPSETIRGTGSRSAERR